MATAAAPDGLAAGLGAGEAAAGQAPDKDGKRDAACGGERAARPLDRDQPPAVLRDGQHVAVAGAGERRRDRSAVGRPEQVLEAVAVGRNLMGVTDGAKAPPGTVRGDFALSVQNNLVHGSDRPENAATEIALWFRPEELGAFASTEANRIG